MIRTKRGAIKPEARINSAISRASKSHDINFGVGPAGTARPTWPWYAVAALERKK